jgi:hypothetical protein
MLLLQALIFTTRKTKTRQCMKGLEAQTDTHPF